MTGGGGKGLLSSLFLCKVRSPCQFRIMLKLNHVRGVPCEARAMNTVKLLLCSIPSTGLFGNIDNQGDTWPLMAGLQWLCAVWLYLLEYLKSGIKF